MSGLFLSGLPFTSLAQASSNPEKTSTVCQNVKDRPCIALVLAGGGARGSSHVGVLQVLEENRVPIDLVVGTSMGSFVGGLYASGKSAAEIEQLFIRADWTSGYVDDLPRSRIPNRRKRHNDQYPIQLGIGFDGDGFKLPKGIFQGQGMRRLIDIMLGSQPTLESFDDLPISYRAVAANIENGEEVVIDHGDLATAMQASMSLPGVLRPIVLDGKVLVDGGIANNLPVSVAKNLGADVVIAVDIGSLPASASEIENSFDVLNQLSNFLTYNNQEAARALMTESDLLIQPDLNGISMTDFSGMERGMQAGYVAASAHAARLQALSDNDNKRYLADGPRIKQVSEQINHITLDNRTRLADDYLLFRMGLDADGPYTQKEILDGIELLYGQGTIARVTTFVEQDNDQTTMKVLVEEKEWGPGYVDFLFNFEDNFRSFSIFELGASIRLTNLSPYGAEWTSSVQFGTDKSLKTELYWPLYTSGVFLQADGEYSQEISNFIDNSGNNLGELITIKRNASGGIGYEFSNSFDIITGLETEGGNVELPDSVANSFGVKTIDYDSDSAFVKADYDSLDEADFSREGVKLGVIFRRSYTQALNFDEYSNKFESNLSFAHSVGAHTLKPTLRFGNAYSDGPIGFSNFELGGFLNLSGLERDFLSGPFLRFARIVYTYQLAENPMGGTSLPFYLGVSAEAGNIWDKKSEMSWGTTVKSGAVFLGWASPIGPAFLGYGRTDKHTDSFYISLGKRF